MRDPSELRGVAGREELVPSLVPGGARSNEDARSVAYTSLAVSSADDTSRTSSPITIRISPESIG